MPFVRAHWRKLAALALAILLFAAGRFSARGPKVEQHEEAKLQESSRTSATAHVETAAAVQTSAQAIEEKVRIVYRTLVVQADGSSRLDERIEEGSRADYEITKSDNRSSLEDAKQEAQTDRELLTRKDLRIDPSLPDWKVSGLAGVDVQDWKPVVGAQVERRIIGPLFVGVWALSSGQGGVVVSVEL